MTLRVLRSRCFWDPGSADKLRSSVKGTLDSLMFLLFLIDLLRSTDSLIIKEDTFVAAWI